MPISSLLPQGVAVSSFVHIASRIPADQNSSTGYVTSALEFWESVSFRNFSVSHVVKGGSSNVRKKLRVCYHVGTPIRAYCRWDKELNTNEAVRFSKALVCSAHNPASVQVDGVNRANPTRAASP